MMLIPQPEGGFRDRVVATMVESIRHAQTADDSATGDDRLFPAGVETVRLCRALAAECGAEGAAFDFGRGCCGFLDQEEMVQYLRLILLVTTEFGHSSTDEENAVAAAVAGFQRQAETFRYAEMLTDPLSGLDSEPKFLTELWNTVSRRASTFLAVFKVPSPERPENWTQLVELGALWREIAGVEGLGTMGAGNLLVRASSAQAAHRCIEATHRRWAIPGRVARVPHDFSSIAELAWWLTGIYFGPEATAIPVDATQP